MIIQKKSFICRDAWPCRIDRLLETTDMHSHVLIFRRNGVETHGRASLHIKLKLFQIQTHLHSCRPILTIFKTCYSINIKQHKNPFKAITDLNIIFKFRSGKEIYK